MNNRTYILVSLFAIVATFAAVPAVEGVSVGWCVYGFCGQAPAPGVLPNPLVYCAQLQAFGLIDVVNDQLKAAMSVWYCV